MKAMFALFAALALLGNGIADEADALIEQGRVDEALTLVEEGVAAGTPEAINYQAWLLDNGEYVAADLPRAIALYRRAAELGQPHAQWRLGVLIDEGKAPGALEEAFALFEAAAEQEFAFAYVSLAVMHATGRGTPQDFAASRRNYELGIAAGNVHAIRGVGVLYALGQGVERDLVEAGAHFLLALRMGNESSQPALSQISGQLSEDELRHMFERANDLARQYGYDVSFDFDEIMQTDQTTT